MYESTESEIDVEVLKTRIRDSVAARENNGQTSFIAASRELYRLLSANESASDLSLSELLIADIAEQQDEPQLSLQPPFHQRSDDRYQLDELLQYHDHAFVWNAYRAILKREPDEEGYQGYLARLRSGRRNKIDILASLRYSPEGQRANVEIEGLKPRAWFRRLYQLPGVGYLMELAVSVARLPLFMRHQRQLENHLIAQQDVIASYIGKQLANHKSYYRDYTAQVAARFAESQTSVNKQHRELAKLQQQQMAVLFRNLKKTSSGDGLNGNSRKARLFDSRWHELYAAFESEFRGDVEVVKNDLKPYVSLLKESNITSEILDLGSGRGEWLELLKAAELLGTGVEANSVFAAKLRSKGLNVIETEALAYLSGLKNESLQAVTAFHLVEHLHFPQLIQLLDEIMRTLRPGGLLIIETPNPKNLVVGACNFYADPTHRHPIFPDTIQFLLNRLGFVRVRIEYLHPATDSPFENNQPGSKELNTWLFGPRDFAVIAWKV